MKNAKYTPVKFMATDFVRDIMRPMNAQAGDDLPVSTFKGIEDGTFEAGTSAYEKRGIAVNVPEWQIDNYAFSNTARLSALIKNQAILVTKAQKAKAPKGFQTKKAKEASGLEEYEYRLRFHLWTARSRGTAQMSAQQRTRL